MHVSHADDVQSKSVKCRVALLEILDDVANNPWLWLTNRPKKGKNMLFYQSIALVRLGITLSNVKDLRDTTIYVTIY